MQGSHPAFPTKKNCKLLVYSFFCGKTGILSPLRSESAKAMTNPGVLIPPLRKKSSLAAALLGGKTGILSPLHSESAKAMTNPGVLIPSLRKKSNLAAALFGGKTGILSPLRSESAKAMTNPGVLIPPLRKKSSLAAALLGGKTGILSPLHSESAKAMTNPGVLIPSLRKKSSLAAALFGGKTGIRTLGTRKGTTVFETVPIDHSGIFPLWLPRFFPCGREWADGFCGAKIRIFFEVCCFCVIFLCEGCIFLGMSGRREGNGGCAKKNYSSSRRIIFLP